MNIETIITIIRARLALLSCIYFTKFLLFKVLNKYVIGCTIFIKLLNIGYFVSSLYTRDLSCCKMCA